MTILFYPEPLKAVPLSQMYRVLSGIDVKWHNDPQQPYDLHIFWSYTKHSIVPDKITLNSPHVINRGCWDINKNKVHDIFNDYRVDPEKHTGLCIKKINLQGRHSGHSLITCPQKREAGYVYERYIENKEGGHHISYSIVYGEGISVIFKKKKSSLFESSYISHEVVDKKYFFSDQQEQELIDKCNRFGFHCGIIDFQMEDRPIILDVNNVRGGGHVSSLTDTPNSDIMDKGLIDYLYHKKQQLTVKDII
jgi:hypothetical protein